MIALMNVDPELVEGTARKEGTGMFQLKHFYNRNYI